MRTSDPLTTPPPSTRSSSPMPVATRSPPSTLISPIGRGRLALGPATRRPPRAGVGRSSTSWTKLPARAQPGHVPGLAAASPHSWQRYTGRSRATSAAPSSGSRPPGRRGAGAGVDRRPHQRAQEEAAAGPLEELREVLVDRRVLEERAERPVAGAKAVGDGAEVGHGYPEV